MAGNGMKGLAKDTAIYGISSILARSLNWCLWPFYMYVFSDPADMGKVSFLYGYVALFLILLTYGMETGFFRFMGKEEENPNKVYATSLISLATTSILFVVLCFLFIDPIASALKYENHNDHILMMAVFVAIDAFMTIPYAYLRYQKRPVRFMTIRVAFIVANILFNLFFYLACPWIYKNMPELIEWFYNPDYGIGYIFVANLLSTAIVLIILLLNTLKGVRFSFDSPLLKRMLKYSFPLLILGVAGVVSQVVAQLTYPYIFDDLNEAHRQLGIYQSCLKFAMIITMFIQAFRYAYEPFVFGRNKGKDNRQSYADAMKYFVIFALLLFVGIMYYIDIIQQFILWIGAKNYVVGLNILPPAMLGEVCFGIYFNLSIWYKLTDNTRFGAWFSIIGCVLQVVMNIFLVPMFGYIASAWATLAANALIMTISYIFGQKYYPIKYDVKTILFYFVIAIVFYVAGMYVPIENEVLRLSFRTVLLIIFMLIIIKKDLPLKEIPIINKFLKKK
ncbi:lipopolysaccharide biosynthesis protein [Dysgonomonas sp. 25]|uniref:lipopolysaccharide biosynthesis protein n=1 Tax=Dysgonomonas sp. 25 TaxID=2302933 RepID=UPI0013D491BA|nr:MATE family efflux transporter [Dysgonomonas sp. 25]NDV67626.1 lipopolysaccharide biosynthesis protein [Dysgonomonas sp. 25]